jgi:hypothetical protein
VTYAATTTFWIEPTERVAVGLRRYHSPEGSEYDCAGGYHSALVFTGEAQAQYLDSDYGRVLDSQPGTAHDDPRWPAACSCGYEFTDDDHWQDWQELIYRRADTGDEMTLRTRQASDVGGPPGAPPGAMWDAWWMPEAWRGPDGIALMVRLPNGSDWHVDSQASNCTRKGQKHECWVRHGDPRTGQVHVDKDGDTCSAGAGSILAGDYHGFLHHGVLTAA